MATNTASFGGTGLSAGKDSADSALGSTSLGWASGFPTVANKGLDIAGQFNFPTSTLHKDMTKYSHRLESFSTYPIKPYHPRPSELAALGFYYVGRDDKVKCFSCNICVHNWEAGDLVLNEHYRWALGNCRYLNHITNFRQ